jgi:hypothetical protein
MLNLNNLLHCLVIMGVVEFENISFTFMCDNVVVVEFQCFVFTFSCEDHVIIVDFLKKCVMLNLSVCFNLV